MEIVPLAALSAHRELASHHSRCSVKSCPSPDEAVGSMPAGSSSTSLSSFSSADTTSTCATETSVASPPTRPATHGSNSSTESPGAGRAVEISSTPLSGRRLELINAGGQARHITIIAPSDDGLKKIRRMSTGLPANYKVDSCHLRDEFVSASRLPWWKGRRIGKGAGRTVRIVYKRGERRDVAYAVKEFRKSSRKESDFEHENMVKSEFSIASSLDHPNIVKSVRLCTQGRQWKQVMEYCSYGNLDRLAHKQYMKVDDILCLFKQLLQGVAYLHSQGIAHRDIRLDNLLLTHDSHLKITDFGCAQVFRGIHPGLREAGSQWDYKLDEVRKSAPGMVGTVQYVAPEVVAKRVAYDPRALDVWSCAIVCFTLFFRGAPWNAAEPTDPMFAPYLRAWKTFAEQHPDGSVMMEETDIPLFGNLFTRLPSLGLQRLLLAMLNPDPEKRISIDTALQDRFICSIDCCCPDSATLERRARKYKSMTPRRHTHGPPPPTKRSLF